MPTVLALVLLACRSIASGQRAFVRFDGVYMNSDVWLNGAHLGFHPYGYTTFEYELTPHLRQGAENVLAVKVANLGRNSRYYSGCEMVMLPRFFVLSVSLTLKVSRLQPGSTAMSG